MDLDPTYVDLSVRRWQSWTGQRAVHQATGRLFDDVLAEATADADAKGADHE
jgi:hypothetical protein